MTTFSQAQPRGGSKRQIWFAVGLGLVAAVLVIVFLNSVNDDSGGGAAVAAASVVVASQPINSGDKITAGMLTTKSVPESSVVVGTITEVSAAEGRIARYPIERGETVTAARLVDSPKVKALSFQIPAGLRGMTIPVDVNKTPAALIAPGDFVDVIVSVEASLLTGRVAGSDQRDLKGAATIVQNIQVISVDRNFADNGVVYEPSVRGAPPEEKDKVGFVTLAVLPEQAQLLWLAQDKGKLTLVLRAFGDDKIVPLAPKLEPLTLQ